MSGTTLYYEGTADFTNGSASVTGHGVVWADFVEGDPVFGPDGKWYEVATAGEDSLVLERPYEGATVAGSTYVIFRSSKSRDSVRQATKELSAISTKYRQIINLTSSDQTLKLNRNAETDQSGIRVSTNGIETLQLGAFGDDEFSIRYILGTAWTKAMGIDPDTGAIALYSQLKFGGIITPPILTADQNNYDPLGLAQANVVRLTSAAGRRITGLAGGTPGRVVALMNASSYPMTLEAESDLSDAANRFQIPSDTSIGAWGVGILFYDPNVSRWRLMVATGNAAGERGWSPLTAAVVDGERRVLQIVAWEGGQGTPPATGRYLGDGVLVDDIADAVDIRGEIGPRGFAATIQVAVETGEPGTDAAVVNAGDDHDANLLITIPRGDKGETGASYKGTSATALTIALEEKTIVTQAGMAYTAGTRVRLASAAAPTTKIIEGIVSAYAGTNMVIQVDKIVGVGTASDWTVSLAGAIGVQGDKGNTGPKAWADPVAWATGLVFTATAPASVVTFDGETWLCTTPHTAGASFDASKFIKIAAKGANGEGAGDFVGPAAATDGNLVAFDGTTGKAGKDSGFNPSSLGDLAYANKSSLPDPVAYAIVFGA